MFYGCNGFGSTVWAPLFFVTVTCNLYWLEITEQLLPGETPQDRQDVVSRVYHAKLRDLREFMVVKGHFGKVAAWAHLTEFQKRGLPHEHFLLIMEKNSKLNEPDMVVKGHFGKVAACTHLTEFQKRGLPHEHFLLIMEKNSKLNGPDDFDRYI
jgi:hypothetical protein